MESGTLTREQRERARLIGLALVGMTPSAQRCERLARALIPPPRPDHLEIRPGVWRDRDVVALTAWHRTIALMGSEIQRAALELEEMVLGGDL